MFRYELQFYNLRKLSESRLSEGSLEYFPSILPCCLRIWYFPSHSKNFGYLHSIECISCPLQQNAVRLSRTDTKHIEMPLASKFLLTVVPSWLLLSVQNTHGEKKLSLARWQGHCMKLILYFSSYFGFNSIFSFD